MAVRFDFYRSQFHRVRGIVGSLWYEGFEKTLGLHRSRAYDIYARLHHNWVTTKHSLLPIAMHFQMASIFEAFVAWLIAPLVIYCALDDMFSFGTFGLLTRNPIYKVLRPIAEDGGMAPHIIGGLFLSAVLQILLLFRFVVFLRFLHRLLRRRRTGKPEQSTQDASST